MLRRLPELGVTEAKAILRAYPRGSGDVTAELLAFGRMLLDKTEERGGSLDHKATVIVGYAGVVLAFLVANAEAWSKQMQSGERWAIVAAGVAALVAAFAGGVAMRGRRWAWFSEKDWLRVETLRDAEALRRYYLLATYEVQHRNQRICDAKARGVVIAQTCLAGSVIALALALLLNVLPRLLGH
jgi:hypothetical protein